MGRMLSDLWAAIITLKNDFKKDLLTVNGPYLKRGLMPVFLCALALIPAWIDIAFPDDSDCYSDVGVPCFEDIAGPLFSTFIIVIILIGWHLFMLVKTFTAKRNGEVWYKNLMVLLYPYILIGNGLLIQFFVAFDHDGQIAKQTYQVDCRSKTLVKGEDEAIVASFRTGNKNYVITGVEASKRDKDIRHDDGVVRLNYKGKEGGTFDVITRSIKAYEIGPGKFQAVKLSAIDAVEKKQGTEIRNIKQGPRDYKQKEVSILVYQLPPYEKPFPHHLDYDSDQKQLTVKMSNTQDSQFVNFEPLYGFVPADIYTNHVFTGKQLYHFVKPRPINGEESMLQCDECLHLAEFGDKQSRGFQINPAIARQLKSGGYYRVEHLRKSPDHLYVIGKQKVFYFEIPELKE